MTDLIKALESANITMNKMNEELLNSLELHIKKDETLTELQDRYNKLFSLMIGHGTPEVKKKATAIHMSKYK